MKQMQTKAPARKVTLASVGSAVAAIVIWLLNTHVLNEPLSADAVTAVGAIASFVAPLAVGYVVRPGMNDQVVDC